MSFRYILRYLIDPHFESVLRMEELVNFCAESKIEEVMLFITAEELSAGHPTSDELTDYMQIGKDLKQRLDAKGIALSLNPWSTIYHNFRGRWLREGQDFRRMVGETGVTNQVAVCPLCPNWQDYLCSSFAMLAREINPTTIWIEDDWRLRNHDAALGWGGCFCEEHIRIFSELVGQNVSREELLAAVLKSGTPHPWREEWMRLSCETLVQPLARVSNAIRGASPETRVALMSSSPDAHSSEGRDWKCFQEAVGNSPTFISRPNMAPYTQVPALHAPPSLTRMTMANLSGPVEIYPELENSPRCGPYSKSAKYSVWQMMNCAFVGSNGITINHYDMLGNGISLDPTFGRALRDAKDMLNAVIQESVDDRKSDGVDILFSPEASKHMQTNGATSISALMQESYLWGDACGILGVAHRYVSSLQETKAPVLISGQTLRAFPENELRNLFSRHVILDADAVVVALDLGLGDIIGVQSAEWIALRDSAYSYEEILEDDPAIYGLKRPRMTAQRCAASLLSMESLPSARVLTRIHRCDHAPLWPGCVLFANPLGGVVASLTYPVGRQAQFFMGFFNAFRRIFLQRLLFSMAPNAPLAMVACHPMHCYRTATSQGLRLAVTNPTDDTSEAIVVDLPSHEINGGTWTKLDRSGTWTPIFPEMHSHSTHDRFSFPVRLEYLEGVLLLWQKKSL